MVRRGQLDPLALRKQALILESDLNRLSLQTELRTLRSATTWASEATAAGRRLGPWLLLLAPVAGLLAIRRLRRPGSAIGRLISVLRWVQPLYSLWRGFKAGQR